MIMSELLRRILFGGTRHNNYYRIWIDSRERRGGMGRGLKKKLILLVCVLSVLMFLWVIFLEKEGTMFDRPEPARVTHLQEPTYPRKELRNGLTEDSYRVVHLDLKGGAPRLEYLRRLLPLLAEQGCDALLVEYEDMFPFTDSLANISAKNAYSRKEVRKLLSWAHDLNMEVIPLVQTFGHLEYVLKLKEFQHLRELADFPGEVCPSKSKSLELIEEMLTQVVGMHKGLRYIHLGADEVFHIGACSRCAKSNPRELFTRYVTEVAEIVHRKFPGVTPIIWDDMMRSWVPNLLTSSPLVSLVEPMVWAYSEEVTALIPHYVWYWYSKTFKRVWIAGAFKGANLPTSDLPDLTARYRNTRSWLSLAQDAHVSIAGFVLTGWSRFDHFAVLCELLPASMPSLLLNLIAISRQHMHQSEEHQSKRWRIALGCSPSAEFTLRSYEHSLTLVGSCVFPGSDVYNAILRYTVYKVKADSMYATLTQNKGWMTRYNVRHNFTSSWRLIEDYTAFNTHAFYMEIQKFKSSVRKILLNYIDPFGADEWIEQRIAPIEERLTEISKTIERLITRQTWPRRPL